MSHVDEGALHAYLDGALDEYPPAEASRIRNHLDGCPACVERLEEERRIRSAAGAILDLAVPSVEIPSFEELRAYVRATRPAASPGALRLYRLGWAASVMLALGVGYFVRDGQLGTTEVTAPAATSVDPTTARLEATATRGTAARQAGAAEVPASEEVVGAAESESRETQAPDLGAPGWEATAASAPEPSAPGAASIEGVAFADQAVAEKVEIDDVAQVSPTDLDQQASLGAVTVAAGRAAGALDSAAAADVLAPVTTVAGGGVAAAPSETLLSVQPLTRDTGSANAVIPEAVAEARPAEEAARDRDAEETAGRRAVAAPALRAQVSPSARADFRRGAEPGVAIDATELEDEAPLGVPGLPLIGIENLVEGTTPGGVHIQQRLGNGEVLDVYRLPESVNPSVLPPVEEGRNEVRAQRDGEWVILRAALDPETLGELLTTLGPVG